MVNLTNLSGLNGGQFLEIAEGLGESPETILQKLLDTNAFDNYRRRTEIPVKQTLKFQKSGLMGESRDAN